MSIFRDMKCPNCGMYVNPIKFYKHKCENKPSFSEEYYKEQLNKRCPKQKLLDEIKHTKTIEERISAIESVLYDKGILL